jgi:hypothetical protein
VQLIGVAEVVLVGVEVAGGDGGGVGKGCCTGDGSAAAGPPMLAQLVAVEKERRVPEVVLPGPAAAWARTTGDTAHSRIRCAQVPAMSRRVASVAGDLSSRTAPGTKTFAGAWRRYHRHPAASLPVRTRRARVHTPRAGVAFDLEL